MTETPPASEYNFPAMQESSEARIKNHLTARGLWLGVAESCTGGFISHRITNIPGASAFFRGGIVSYANETKMALLGVQKSTLEQFGAVSEQTVKEMARGVRDILSVDFGLAVSGVAGPSGGTPEKPVGTVWIGLSAEGEELSERFFFQGDRHQIKEQAAQAALEIGRAHV